MEGVEVQGPTPQECHPQQVASNNSVKSEDYQSIQSNLSQFFSAGDDCHRPLNQQARYLFFDTHRDNHQDEDQFDGEFYSHAIAYFTPDEDENQNCNQNQNQLQNELAELIYDCICENTDNDNQNLQRSINYDDFQAVIALEPDSEDFNFQQNSVNSIIFPSEPLNDQPYTSQEIEDQSGISLLGNENNVNISLPIILPAQSIEPSSIISLDSSMLSNQSVSQNIEYQNNHELISFQINRVTMEQENNLIIKGIQQKFLNRHAEQSDSEIYSYQGHIFIHNENSYHRSPIMVYLDNT